MGLLIVPRDEQRRFRADDIKALLSSLSGTSTLNDLTGGLMSLAWAYADRGETADGRLHRGGEAINLDPESIAAASLAVAISQRTAFPLDLINDQYTFQLPLDKYSSADDLWSAIQIAYREATDGPEPYRG